MDFVLQKPLGHWVSRPTPRESAASSRYNFKYMGGQTVYWAKLWYNLQFKLFRLFFQYDCLNKQLFSLISGQSFVLQRCLRKEKAKGWLVGKQKGKHRTQFFSSFLCMDVWYGSQWTSRQIQVWLQITWTNRHQQPKSYTNTLYKILSSIYTENEFVNELLGSYVMAKLKIINQWGACARPDNYDESAESLGSPAPH